MWTVALAGDCHGLPVEMEIEQALDLHGKSEIERFGLANFNAECRKIVLRYTEEWEKTVRRTGRWVDFRNDYRTMDLPFMETVWWALRQMWDKDLVYEGYKVVPFSTRLGTVLSNFEANLNYKDVQDPTVHRPLCGRRGGAHLVYRLDHHAVDPAQQSGPGGWPGHRLRQGPRP